MPTSTAKKMSVDQAEAFAARCDHLRTPVTSSTAMPPNAAAVAGMPSRDPPHQSTRSSTKVAAMIRSWPDSGPSPRSSARAWAGASGVRVSVGGYTRDIAHGTTTRLRRPGTRAASAQPPQVTSMPMSAAAFWATGLPAMAVTNMAEVTVLTCTLVSAR